MDHSGTKKKASCTKGGTQVRPQGCACISPSQVPVHLWSKR